MRSQSASNGRSSELQRGWDREWRLTALQDSTLSFEKRRNVPIPYDRDLVQATMAGMKRIAEVRAKREKAFYKARYVVDQLARGQFARSSRVDWS